MQCPYCGGDSQVVDSRTSTEGVRRRRTCNDCKRRFTTYERLGAPSLKVIKRDGHSEPFDSAKIVRVLERVGRDRQALGAADAMRIARTIEAELLDDRVKSVRSSEVVDRLLTALRPVDKVAHDRLASNYVDESGSLRTDGRTAEPVDTGQLGLFSDDDD